eukprot:TRINITY_DN2972_c1_g1_i4.p1 TRINITY_DN2972_c1_g1~~TRINITY_DN2972_c1_g1_i4.p1  ORF type:complete len:377 (-),score=18.20 TRINITY_DN2972_c1_g1_i4:287-1417(-)
MPSYEDQVRNRIEEQINALNKYTVRKFLGEGGFGKVVRASLNLSGDNVAIKVLDRQTMCLESNVTQRRNNQKWVEREILHQRALTGHPLIVEFKEVFLTQNFICIVMEYVEGGNLLEYVTTCVSLNRDLTEDEARAWFQQLIVGLKFSHDLNIVNRDVKLENTLRSYHPGGIQQGWWGQKDKVDSSNDNYWYLKICDFGYSKNTQLNSAPTSRVGSLAYASPEVLYAKEGEVYDGKKRDVWSCGVMLFCLLVGMYPFDPDSLNINELYESIRLSNYSFPPGFNISYEAQDLVYHMLEPDPMNRYSLEQVIQHQWFQINLPRDWNKSFGAEVADKKTGLQSEEEIKALIDIVFQEAPQPLTYSTVDSSIDDLVYRSS